MAKLDSSWKHLKEDFKLVSVIGSGSYGVVAKAKARATGQIVAIKKVDCNF